VWIAGACGDIPTLWCFTGLQTIWSSDRLIGAARPYTNNGDPVPACVSARSWPARGCLYSRLASSLGWSRVFNDLAYA